MRALTALAAIAAALALAGCGTKVRSCKAGTVLLTVDIPAGSDQLALDVSIDGAAATTQTVTLPASAMSHGTVELDFSSYPAGHTFSVIVTAVGAGQTIAVVASPDHVLAAGCDAITLSFGTSMSGDDLAAGGGDDLAGSDGGSMGCGTCPTGTSCDVAHGVCTTACSATQPCNGGCCDGARCVTGDGSDKCALGQTLCGSCAGKSAGSACLPSGGARVCGCNSATDCPPNQACDPATHTCTSSCDATRPCNGGCCSAAGTCQTGTDPAVCGNNGGACAPCSGNQNGHLCIAVSGGGQCGCNALGDCATGASGCSAQHLCVNNCDATTMCQSGCCSASSMGTCQPGTSPTLCGAAGTVCQPCAANPNGSACLPSSTCGCNGPADCPVDQACDTTTHKCTTACSANQPCHGGCCSNGSCVAGNSTSSCGSGGGACSVCTTLPTSTCTPSWSCNGTSCVPLNLGGSTSCNDGNACTFNDVCQGNGNCAGTAYSCPGSDTCQTVTCNGTGTCDTTYHPGVICGSCTCGDVACDSTGGCTVRQGCHSLPCP